MELCRRRDEGRERREVDERMRPSLMPGLLSRTFLVRPCNAVHRPADRPRQNVVTGRENGPRGRRRKEKVYVAANLPEECNLYIYVREVQGNMKSAVIRRRIGGKSKEAMPDGPTCLRTLGGGR